MGLIRTSLLTAVATKLVDEARKPENQRRAKELFRQLQEQNRKRKQQRR